MRGVDEQAMSDSMSFSKNFATKNDQTARQETIRRLLTNSGAIVDKSRREISFVSSAKYSLKSDSQVLRNLGHSRLVNR